MSNDSALVFMVIAGRPSALGCTVIEVMERTNKEVNEFYSGMWIMSQLSPWDHRQGAPSVLTLACHIVHSRHKIFHSSTYVISIYSYYAISMIRLVYWVNSSGLHSYDTSIKNLQSRVCCIYFLNIKNLFSLSWYNNSIGTFESFLFSDINPVFICWHRTFTGIQVTSVAGSTALRTRQKGPQPWTLRFFSDLVDDRYSALREQPGTFNILNIS